ncbi:MULTISPECIES: T9SS type A sorting domain-containing protein [Aequorivita]|uniref:T9SS type A sorting domain-containing protein n=1 Tax=Aequorivita iocasae TaxID=2803865 RepID=A0ABX7DPQ0_9FLAO|nr:MULTISPECIES: T9SS type A sorting domain-containing protein [Aequorivita]QQX75503.1 T9SS type A sorting domain-containing protein [Aequorivita iocasae]UCA54956.1 T9SS type A sorting domain-containing protein [Aequorivita sp. F7]
MKNPIFATAILNQYSRQKVMNLRVLLFFFLMSIAASAQIINIPDANFKNALVNTICADLDANGSLDGDVDTNNDGEIDVDEAENVFRLVVDDQNIDSMEGLQYFIHLFRLSCQDNNLTELDLSALQYLETIGCGRNQLTTLDFSGNWRLEHIVCEDNNLIEINITQCVNLERLYAYGNQLTSLDLSLFPQLRDLNLQINNFTHLDVSQNPLLDSFNCGDNQLSTLDITQNPLIDWLVCVRNDLEILDMRNGNNSILETLQAQGNPLLECILVDEENAPRPECDPPWNDGWCVDPGVRFSEDCLLSTAEFTKSAFTIFPNPAGNVLNIKSSKKIDQVKIYSLQGRLISEGSEPNLDLSKFAAGTYIVKVLIDGTLNTKMLVKK